MPRLFCFGLGYSAGALACALRAQGWSVGGTHRGPQAGPDLYRFADDCPPPPADMFLSSEYLLSSVPPGAAGDPVLRQYGAAIAAGSFRWIGYLSTTGVYGDHEGREVTEASPCRPSGARQRARLAAEQEWQKLGAHVFRLAGIYGPGRSVLDQIRAGTARHILRPGHRFGRIHVEDIVGILRASMSVPQPGSIYNLADDLPAEPAAILAYGCALLNVPLPPATAPEDAVLSPMALSFWRDHKTVSNRKVKAELGYVFRYPSYREGLAAIMEQNREDRAAAARCASRSASHEPGRDGASDG
ncbi:MAG TPA: SDR family oxidoreductase [Dongiaceae bacterium]|jgi:hypothetical protein|nr:SDR family oxidoreductase [Dongiaceae bacterium]